MKLYLILDRKNAILFSLSLILTITTLSPVNNFYSLLLKGISNVFLYNLYTILYYTMLYYIQYVQIYSLIRKPHE